MIIFKDFIRETISAIFKRNNPRRLEQFPLISNEKLSRISIFWVFFLRFDKNMLRNTSPLGSKPKISKANSRLLSFRMFIFKMNSNKEITGWKEKLQKSQKIIKNWNHKPGQSYFQKFKLIHITPYLLKLQKKYCLWKIIVYALCEQKNKIRRNIFPFISWNI